MKTTTTKLILGLILTSALIGAASTARAEIIGGIDFPQGALSFADAVVSYAPFSDGPSIPDPRWMVPADALGTPNYTPPAPQATTHNEGQFVSLGNGGFLTLQFINNRLTGSGNAGHDLYIFEVGPEVEKTHIWISQNNIDWLYVGFVAGATGGIDIDPVLTAESLPYTTQFAYVRLQDDAAQYPDTDRYGFYAGADIDAVGAISSTIPEPATLVLMGVAGTILVVRRRQARKNTL
ncbi:MAG: PEP-CTERM sorting domain-containing protein [Planctomycetaceae bacterium]|nr:PEP-CTERM sorting domain-containing protein [Planctomycetaceae bacterium]